MIPTNHNNTVTSDWRTEEILREIARVDRQIADLQNARARLAMEVGMYEAMRLAWDL